MTDTDRIDLSLQVNQNTIAVSLSTFYTVEELELIDLEKLRCPYSQSATNPCGCMEYIVKYDDEKEFKIHCTIDTSIVPNTHFVEMILKNSNLYESSFKCNPNSNNAKYLSLIVKRAINYSKYKNVEDKFYDKHNIIKNFSNRLIDVLGDNLDVFENMKKRSLEVEDECNNSVDGRIDESVNIKYETGNAQIDAYTIDDNMFKFCFKNTDTGLEDYCYFLRGHVGLDVLIICIERSINKIKINGIDDGVF